MESLTDDHLVNELKKLKRPLFRPRVRDSYVLDIAPAASEEQLSMSEERLTFPLPGLLRRLYTEIGNGGFGPGYGLIGCIGGYKDDRGDTIVEAYLGRRERDPEDPTWLWPEKVVPLFSWGGAIYTCGDFATESCPLIEFDPQKHRTGSPLSTAFQSHEQGLGEFLMRWINGETVMLE